ncbi:thioredoxin family protein [Streptococcus ovis]|uniref:thioredoxin family protein n=1 Tax=Streptococcus ovis TaxID=82806 RepID=UPI000370651B|nr:thioredoxin family protein [Streptococcus ovis]
MLTPATYEELATAIEESGTKVLFFTADWCPDCQFIYPAMPEIEAAFPDWTFVRVDRDEFMEVAQQWDIFGIPSFVVVKNEEEVGRFVDKNRKTKTQIIEFLEGLK